MQAQLNLPFVALQYKSKYYSSTNRKNIGSNVQRVGKNEQHDPYETAPSEFLTKSLLWDTKIRATIVRVLYGTSQRQVVWVLIKVIVISSIELDRSEEHTSELQSR